MPTRQSECAGSPRAHCCGLALAVEFAEWATIAAERFAKLTGMYPQLAAGTAMPTTATRTYPAYLDKWDTGVSDNSFSYPIDFDLWSLGNVLNFITMYGMSLSQDCNNNTISENTISNTTGPYAMWIDGSNNNITRNYIYYSNEFEIGIATLGNNSLIKNNVFVSIDDYIIDADPNENDISLNYQLRALPFLCVDIINQLFASTGFTITLEISSGIGIWEYQSADPLI